MNKILIYLEQSSLKYPNKVIFGDVETEITYRCFVEISKSIGTAIIQTGSELKPIMIMMEKKPKTLAAFFAVMCSRNFYVPIDTEMPSDRLSKIFDNLNPAFIICDEENFEKAKQYMSEDKILKFDDLASTEIDDVKLSEVSARMLDVDPIYIICTSGTTGVPKGVTIPQRALVDYVDAFNVEIKVNHDDVFANQAPFYFDGSLIDIYCIIKNAATTYIIPTQYFTMPMKLIEFLNDKKITAFRWVPSGYNMISAFDVFSELTPKYLKTAIFVGEVMPAKVFNYWKTHLPNVDYIQIYGPTEIVGVCTCHHITETFENDEKIPIGKAMSNCEVFLLDDDDKIVTDIGVQAEICVKGSCLALGYYNMPEKTKDVFVQNPANTCFNDVIYHTGDLAMYNEKYELLFVGRKDFQIKHMGYRIELGEIEATTLTINGITGAVAVYDEKKDNIVVYYTTNNNLDAKALKNLLKVKLTAYMTPQKVIMLEEMPKLPNGKINRVELKNRLTLKKEKK